MSINNEALTAEQKYRTSIEEAQDYIENFDILETINNVGNDEVFTPVKICKQMLDILPDEVWSNPDYKWLNPSDKNGVFPREIAIRLNEGLKEWEPDEEKRKKHILQNMLYSIGLTKFTSQVSRRTLYYCSDANRKFDGKLDKHGKSINGYAIGNGNWFNSTEGNILTPKSKHVFDKHGKCIFCGTKDKDKKGNPGRYSDPDQIEHYAYEFIHTKEINSHLQKRFFGGKKMKFDIVIGNPPYQLDDGGGTGSSARPIYNLFVEQAIKLNPKYLSMIIPSRWFSGGKGLDDFRALMINDKRIKKLYDFLESTDCFPTVKIEGGVCYFLWDSGYNGECKVTIQQQDGKKTTSKRYLNENNKFDIFIRDNTALEILKKVKSHKLKSFSSVVSPRNPFNIGKIDPNFFQDSDNTNLKVLGRFDGKREIRNLNKNFIVEKNVELINEWKLFVSKADGAAGQIGNPIPARIIGQTEVGGPGVVCTETFLTIGPFKNRNEVFNVKQYMNTKFFRFMVGIRKNKNMTQSTYKFAPLMPFENKYTDQMLYDYFNLNSEEISYIEKMIEEL